MNHSKILLSFLCTSALILVSGCEGMSPGKKVGKEPVVEHKAIPSVAEEARAEVMVPVSSGPLSDSDKISLLEQKVSTLEKEIAGNRPKIAKIDVIEQKFKDLSLGLEKIDATYNMKASDGPTPAHMAIVKPALSPVPVPPIPQEPIKPSAETKPVESEMKLNEQDKVEAPKLESSKPVALTPSVTPPPPVPATQPPNAEVPKIEASKAEVPVKKIVYNVRIGEQAGFSRLVLDMGQKEKVTYDIDNDEKILVIDVAGFQWEGPKSGSIPNSPMIASYQAQSDEKGAHLVVQLKKPAKVANYSSIGPTGGKSARAVLDIKAQ